MTKIKRFWCELFNDHEWEEAGSGQEYPGIWYTYYKCKKCGKKKRERAPTIIPSIFGTGRKK